MNVQPVTPAGPDEDAPEGTPSPDLPDPAFPEVLPDAAPDQEPDRAPATEPDLDG